MGYNGNIIANWCGRISLGAAMNLAHLFAFASRNNHLLTPRTSSAFAFPVVKNLYLSLSIDVSARLLSADKASCCLTTLCKGR